MNIEKILTSIPGMDKAKRDTARANAERILHSGPESQKPAARQFLERLAACEIEERDQRLSRIANMSPTDRIVEAFGIKPMSETDRKVIQVLLDHPGLTSTALSEKLGWAGSIWHRRFGGLCKDRMADLWLAPHAEKRNDHFYSGILADLSEGTNLFTMKPQAVEAFAKLGLHPKGNHRQ